MALRNAPPQNQRSPVDLPPGQGPSSAQSIFGGMLRIAGRDPYTPGELALLARLAIAFAGALGPAVWAAVSRTTTTLRAE